jgi:hypothetical protein
MASIIPEEDVSIETLDELFTRTFHQTEIDEDGDIYITDGLEFPIWVSVDDRQKLIRLLTFIRRDPESHRPFTEASANLLNTSVVLPTFFVTPSSPDRLWSHHFISYRDGLIDNQFIGLVRRFAGASAYGARRLAEHVLH